MIKAKLFEMFTQVEATRAFSRAVMKYYPVAHHDAHEHASAAKVFCARAARQGSHFLPPYSTVLKIFLDFAVAECEAGAAAKSVRRNKQDE